MFHIKEVKNAVIKESITHDCEEHGHDHLPTSIDLVRKWTLDTLLPTVDEFIELPSDHHRTAYYAIGALLLFLILVTLYYMQSIIRAHLRKKRIEKVVRKAE
jgi:hypothetical protein